VSWRRYFIPLLLAGYALLAFSRYDWLRPLERHWRPEQFPISAMRMFWRVPDRPRLHELLDEIRRGER
jgi:hypothetical protein